MKSHIPKGKPEPIVLIRNTTAAMVMARTRPM